MVSDASTVADEVWSEGPTAWRPGGDSRAGADAG
jgi:hypothetical protein